MVLKYPPHVNFNQSFRLTIARCVEQRLLP